MPIPATVLLRYPSLSDFGVYSIPPSNICDSNLYFFFNSNFPIQYMYHDFPNIKLYFLNICGGFHIACFVFCFFPMAQAVWIMDGKYTLNP